MHSKHTPVILAALLLAGCGTVNAGPFAGAGGDATYLKRETGEMQHCRHERADGPVGAVVIGVQGGNAYARCKTALEAAGFERMK